jgi:glycosyltransferase involved in cell wall biosynthesis
MNYIVSIIIPVYKVEAYIERCLLSVMHQTYHDSAFECILVDDCSPDNSISIAQNLINGYHGIIDFKIIRNDKNRGLSVARNNGMKHATGKYIFFLDSDDYLKEDCLQVMLGIAAIHPDAEMIMGNSLDKRLNMAFVDYSDKDDYCILDNNQLLKGFYFEGIPPMAWNSLISRELVVNNQLSFKPNLIHEDNLWASKLFPLVSKFIFIPRITLIYEDNPSSITNSIGTAKDLKHRVVIMDELLKAFDNSHFVAYALFLSISLLRMLDMSKCCSEDMREKVIQQRNQLMKHSLRHGRIVLVLFELLMYNPLSQLLRFRFVRYHIDMLKKQTYTIASFFNFLHQ